MSAKVAHPVTTMGPALTQMEASHVTVMELDTVETYVKMVRKEFHLQKLNTARFFQEVFIMAKIIFNESNYQIRWS